MKIIADTNVWYNLGDDPALFQLIKSEPICPTFVNLFELTRTDNIINRPEVVKKALQCMLHFKTNLINEPPPIYLAKIFHGFPFDHTVLDEDLEAAERLANGAFIDTQDVEKYRALLRARRSAIDDATKAMNEDADRIRQLIAADTVTHLAIDSIPMTASFIDYAVRRSTNEAVTLDGVDGNQITLLLYVLDQYLKVIETTTVTVKRNDWYDFFTLAYVQPGDKFWTCDKPWITRIKKAGLEDYLYIQPCPTAVIKQNLTYNFLCFSESQHAIKSRTREQISSPAPMGGRPR